MKLAVTGAEGMLGKEVCHAARLRDHQVLSLTHDDCDISLAEHARTYIPIDSDVIINCAGVTSTGWHSAADMVAANAVGPYRLMETGIPVVHMSTDCVFGRDQRDFGAASFIRYDLPKPDPTDLYGRTKALGEVRAPNVCNVRGSFIGIGGGLLHWLMENRGGNVEGWKRAQWSGTTVTAMADALLNIAEHFDVHAASTTHVAPEKPITKDRLLSLLNIAFDLGVTVHGVDAPVIFRALSPDIPLPSIEACILDYVETLREREVVA